MNQKFTFLSAIFVAFIFSANAQNTFPANGNVGIGTLSPATNLQVIGTSRTGSAANYAQVDGNGNLRFFGTGNYRVAGNHYAFQYAANTNYGLFFNSTDSRYEFLDASQRPIFRVHADNGNGFFSGGLQINNTNETLPGNMRWNGIDFEGYDGSQWKSFTGGQSWTIKGNTNTDASVNFIGTTDAQSLVFKANNLRSGFIDVSGDGNTSFGYNTFTAYSPGIAVYNTAIGYESLSSNTTGNENTATGYQTLYSNTTGYNNIAFGGEALYFNTTGAFNTAIGFRGLFNNVSGNSNTAIGVQSMYENTLGQSNTAIGTQSLYENKTGTENTATGYKALFNNINGNYNTAYGTNALLENMAGESNTGLGGYALNHNTGSYNTAVGTNAMIFNTTGGNNTAVGRGANSNNSSGSNNTALGRNALAANNTGSNNTAIGSSANVSAPNLSNATAMGYSAQATASNQVRIGNSSVTSIGGYVNWSNISDGRYKKNIKENVPGLAFINALKPVTYNLDIKGIDSYLKKDRKESKDAAGNTSAQIKEDDNSIAKKESEIQTGFIAQDVEKAAQKLGYDFSGVDVPKNDNDLYGLRYAEFVVPLVKAVQELSRQNDNLQQQIDALTAMLVNRNQSIENVQKVPVSSFRESKYALEQNIPNPATNSTVIRYSLSSNNGNAFINIYNITGGLLKSVKLTGTGNGQINIQTSELVAGTYTYTLTIDGKMTDSKKMVIFK